MFKRVGHVAVALTAGALSVAAIDGAAGASPDPVGSGAAAKHVLLISVDGLHQSDLTKWDAEHPGSTLAQLTRSGTQYSNTSTSLPSDSFPGLLAMVTGGTPKSTGVYYDDSYDRTLYAPPALGGPSTCTGPAGTETQYAENINAGTNTRNVFGEGIDPAQLPQANAGGGVCAPVYPSDFVRVNSVFGVAHDHGLYTAWSDKHPAYEIVNGHGRTDAVNDLFTPEINTDVVPSSLVDTRGNTVTFPQPSLGLTGYVGNTEAYDQIKVDATLNQIDGKSSQGVAVGKVPAIFGMNFQSVSVGQKLVDSTQASNPAYVPGGYEPGTLTFTPQLEGALSYVDGALGQIVAELKAQGQLASTDIIVSAKHGQGPIDPAKLQKIGHAVGTVLTNAGVGVAQLTDDDVALVWLSDQSQTGAAVKALLADRFGSNVAQVQYLLAGPLLSWKYANPATDSRVPDLIVQPVPGTIYSHSTAKVAEHGGFATDDTHVALLVVKGQSLAGGHTSSSYGGGQGGTTVSSPVTTTQIAPTILAVLGLNPTDLQAAVKEHTQVLPNLGIGGGS